MLKLNKYLRELGINENSWPFEEIKENEVLKAEGEDYDKRYIEGEYEEGFIDAEFFSLDNTLNMEIYSRLCYFRDHCLNAVPGCIVAKYGGENEDSDKAFEKWKEIIDDMIEGFKLKLIDDDSCDVSKHPDKKERENLSKNRKKKINKAMRLFVKYYDALWW